MTPTTVLHLRRAFTTEIPDPITSEVIVANGVAYVSAGTSVYAIDAASGAPLWSAGSCDGSAVYRSGYRESGVGTHALTNFATTDLATFMRTLHVGSAAPAQ